MTKKYISTFLFAVYAFNWTIVSIGSDMTSDFFYELFILLFYFYYHYF